MLPVVALIMWCWYLGIPNFVAFLYNVKSDINLGNIPLLFASVYTFNLKLIHTERPGPQEEEGLEGNLTRKHEWESTTKKASNR